MGAPPAAAPVRLRLEIEDRRLLRRAQRHDGLGRCWVLLGPELATVADLAALVVDYFRLRRSCPGGVVLSIDGLALAPFESTSIFRDNDVVRVKQKSCKNMVRHNDVHCIQDPEIVEKRPLPIDDDVLAIDYKKDDNRQGEQQRDHQHEENATLSHNIENGDTCSKRKWHDDDAGIAESSKTTAKIHIGNFFRNNQTELMHEKVPDCNAPSDAKKVQSRSARRKKLKKKLIREAKEQLDKVLWGFQVVVFAGKE
ncbi:hypothetical protein ACP4OV_019202 [Aristida adscensionis]